MATQAVDPVALGTGTAAAQRSDRGLGAMKSEDFFRLLVTELKQQDPLQPAKTADMIGQVSQIRSIELSKQLTDVLGAFASRQQTTGASELIGKYISAELPDGVGGKLPVSGIVTGVRFDATGGIVLELDNGQAVPATSVTRIQSADQAPQKTGGNGGGGTASNATGSTTAGTSAGASGGPTAGAAASGTDNAATSANGACPTCAGGATGAKTDSAKQDTGGGLLPWLKLKAAFEL
ncbi:MAG: flagellar hook capping FlgD N-terminal domain-containing protein [Planctomycetota bacterium]